MNGCKFCQIVTGEKAEVFIYEDEYVVVIEDHHPRAPIHLLIVSKIHIPTFSDLEDTEMMLAIHKAAYKLIKELQLDLRGYTFGFHGGGQESIVHLHAQLIAGMGDKLVL